VNRHLFALLLAALSAGPTLAAVAVAVADQPAAKKAKPQLVQVIEIQAAPTRISNERTGTLSYARQVRIYNQEEGRITNLPWYEGDHVAAGEELARLDDSLIRAELDRAEAEVHQAELDLKRISDLVAKKAASRDELARARTAVEVARAEASLQHTRLGYTRISAPFAGVITERLVEPGDVAPRHSHLLSLADPASLLAEVKASDLLLPHLKVDDPVSVRIDALGREAHPGRILRIHPLIDPITRLGVVEVVLDPVPSGASAGQFARVTLTSAAVPRLMVPFIALRRDRDGEYVFLMKQGKARRVEVRSGLRMADRIELLQGVEPGQQLIYRGFLGLSDGKAVKPVAATN
jgi:RND family efflux transporter MFP subunit